MYTDEDLDAAVTAGVVTPEAAGAFRDFVRTRSRAGDPDEENLRLITSFNDIFVTIAACLLLWALGWLGGPALIAAAAWAFAEYFTRRRRMALPSIALLLAFVWNVFSAAAGFANISVLEDWGYRLAASAAVATLAAWLHWLRFRVPVTVAAGTVSLAAALLALAMGLAPALRGWVLEMIFLAGTTLFALAMRWDMGDRERRTRRSDVAFWLHLAAAPMLVHPVFAALGSVGADTKTAVAAIAVYLILAVVALAVDRRALLVSALVYVLYAMSVLFKAADSFGGAFPLTALVIGSALLLLSALWRQMRRVVLAGLPASVRDRLPA